MLDCKGSGGMEGRAEGGGREVLDDGWLMVSHC